MQPCGTGPQAPVAAPSSAAQEWSPAPARQEKAEDADEQSDHLSVLQVASPQEEFKANQELVDPALTGINFEAGRGRSATHESNQQGSALNTETLYPSATQSVVARSTSAPSLTVAHSLYSAHVLPVELETAYSTTARSSSVAAEPISFAIAREHHPRLTGRPPISLYLSADYFSFSAYQLLVRRNVEFFEATEAEVESKARSRARPIVIGQVGIRCGFCKSLHPFIRASSATVYPTKKADIYQSAQNIVNAHWDTQCAFLPLAVRNELQATRGIRSGVRASKPMWADRATALGVYEDEHGLKFAPRVNSLGFPSDSS